MESRYHGMKAFNILTGIMFCLGATTLIAEPLKLVSSTPPTWAVGVDPTTKILSLTFDQPIRAGFWDWFGRDVLSPPSSVHVTTNSERTTCSVDVRLQPGKAYICGLNEKGIPGIGFQNEKGLSLPPTFLVFQTAGTPAPDDVPPHVVRAIPGNGETAVDPSRVKSLAVTFDVPMNAKKHGMHLFENETPVDISKAVVQYSADGKTFLLGYNFKPGANYRVELNSTQDIGFTRATRVPLWPVKFAFSTAQPR
jgi:hypothetical protein